MWDCFASAGEGPGATYSADAPTARIDYLFANQMLTAERAWMLRGPEAAACSDHLPLLVDLVLAPDEGGPAPKDPVG
jgi:endonuclease/exonuclease/phosphatase family metal-dependent hydrolase